MFCRLEHEQCQECLCLVEFAQNVKKSGIIELAATYKRSFPNIVYKSDLAVRKIMQLPVCVFGMAVIGPVSRKMYVTEKIEGVDYNSFVSLSEKVWQKQNSSSNMDRQTVGELCNLASSQADKLLIKYVCCEAQELSMNKSRKLYGFQNFHQQKEKINDAMLQLKEISEVVEELSKVKNKAVLNGFGIICLDELSSSELSSSDSDLSSLDSENRQGEIEWQSDEDERTENTDQSLEKYAGNLSFHLDPDSTLDNKNRALVSPAVLYYWGHEDSLSAEINNIGATLHLNDVPDLILRESLQKVIYIALPNSKLPSSNV